MPILFQKLILRKHVKANPSSFYIFGDNIEQYGFGGQAGEMRDEPNAIGIPTKYSPTRYLSDSYFDQVKPFILARFKLIEFYLKENKTIIWPVDNIGTGRAQLKSKAPKIYKYIMKKFMKLRKIY
jgi:hypothetical protein